MTPEKYPAVTTMANKSVETIERRKTIKQYATLGAAALAIAGIAAGGAWGVSEMINSIDPGAKKSPKIESELGPTGEVDPSITSVMLFSGAEVRLKPYLPDTRHGEPDNVIKTIDNPDGVYIKTPDKNVHVKLDGANDIVWYSVNVDGRDGWIDSNHASPVRQEK